MKNLILVLTSSLLIGGLADAKDTSGQSLITANSAGIVKLGMTVAEVRKTVAPMSLSRTSDGEGIALIAVKRGSATVMTLFAGEADPDLKVKENARIEQIWVWEKMFKTAAGVHPGMLLSTAETRYGKILTVTKSEIESREFAAFTNHPLGLEFRVQGTDDFAGVYADGKNVTSQYRNGASIKSINVAVVRRSLVKETGADGPVSFSSVYTDLKRGCTTGGGQEGGHVSTFCKGPGGYQIHYFDSATTLEFSAASDDMEFSQKLASQALDYDTANRKVEWRLANGKPFAVIIRKNTYKQGDDGLIAYPTKYTGEFLIIKGLKGYEMIDGNVDATAINANQTARELADNAFLQAGTQSNRITFRNYAVTAKARGRFTSRKEKARFVVSAEEGQR